MPLRAHYCLRYARHEAHRGERVRAQGDATYLIVNDDGTLANFGVNAVCTHLGCVVPWNKVHAHAPNSP